MSRQNYFSPPIYEVSFQVSFGKALASPAALLKSMAHTLEEHFDSSEEEKQFTVGFTFKGGQASPVEQSKSDGFVLRSKNPRWTCRLKPSTVLIHFTRETNWPRGEYCGWAQFRERLAQVLQAVSAGYGSLPIQRLGLRYLNKIAVPAAEFSLSEWFQVGDFGSDTLAIPAFHDYRKRYAGLGAAGDLSANWRIASSAIEDPDLAKQEVVGFQLDIDVFSQDGLPEYSGIVDWAGRAHVLENALFEASVTDSLRRRFGREVAE